MTTRTEHRLARLYARGWSDGKVSQWLDTVTVNGGWQVRDFAIQHDKSENIDHYVFLLTRETEEPLEHPITEWPEVDYGYKHRFHPDGAERFGPEDDLRDSRPRMTRLTPLRRRA